MRTAALTLAALLLLAGAAHAAVARKEDKRTGVLFRLNGKHLTLKLREQANPRAVKKLVGRQLTAACGTSASSGGTVVDAAFTWPEGRSRVAVDFARDVSRRVAYCVVEAAGSSGRDIAVVRFR
jgi:hypothetical protein